MVQGVQGIQGEQGYQGVQGVQGQSGPSADHDLLIRLNENVNALRVDVANITSGLSSQITDHESRLRVHSASLERQEGASKQMQLIMVISGTILLALEVAVIWFHK